jgi:prolyl-tRNA synthetase
VGDSERYAEVMYWSRLFIPTLREDPAQAQSDAHRLLIRAGYIRHGAQSHCHYLFAGQRSLLKIEAMIRQEMELMGAQEMSFGQLVPGSFVTKGIATELRSHREFPQIWHQFAQTVQQSFSLDLSPDGLEEVYGKHSRAYRRVLDRCGLQYIAAGSDLMAVSEAGDDFLVRGNNYAAPIETAAGIPAPPAIPDPEGDFVPQEFHTPDIKTIAELAAFTGLPETSLIKSLVLESDGGTRVMAVLRGDHQLSTAKLALALDSTYIGTVHPTRLKEWLGADAGSLGPVGVTTMLVIADEALRGRRNLIAGANKNDHHLRNVTPGEDFETRFADIRQVAAGDASVADGAPLRIDKAILLGSLRKLGTGESTLQVKNAAGEESPVRLGHFRLWIERILIAVADANHDEAVLVLPSSIAPFTVVIVPIDFAIEELRRASEEIYGAAREAGLDVVLDDRNVRAGVKFKDADLVGIPYRVIVGKKLAECMVEIVERRSKQRTDVPVGEAVAWIGGRSHGS